jgi:hypothetical protein
LPINTKVILRGSQLRGRTRLAHACEARLQRTLQGHAMRIRSSELRLDTQSGRESGLYRATLAIQPESGRSFLITASANRPWKAAADAAHAARRSLEQERKRKRARSRRARRGIEAQRWAA